MDDLIETLTQLRIAVGNANEEFESENNNNNGNSDSDGSDNDGASIGEIDSGDTNDVIEIHF